MYKKIERDSNYELLRIVSMLFIVLWHVIQYSHLVENTVGVTNFLFNAIMLFIIVHVNCFLLITGYYQSKSKFKLKKLVSLIIEIWFYNILINSILKYSGLVSYTNVDYLVRISFFNLDTFWYIKCYIIVYLLSPFLNMIIDKMDKKTYKRLIIILLLAFSIIPFLTGNMFYATNGFTVIQHILLYFVGAYIRKYNLNINLFSSLNITQKRAFYFISFIIFWIINLLMYIFQLYLSNLDSNISKLISSCILEYKYCYNNPITILQSLAFFLFFSTFKFKNRMINKISSLTLGIYFIHEMKYIHDNIYKWIGLDIGEIIYGKEIILKAIIWAIIIFIICGIIEFIRQLVVKGIFKIKFVRNLYNKFNTWLSNLFEIKA